MAEFVARHIAAAALWVRIQASLKKTTKWATLAKEWPTHSSPPKKSMKKSIKKVTSIDKFATTTVKP